MIGIPRSVRILIGSTPIDMRKSIDGLMAIVQEEMGKTPTRATSSSSSRAGATA